MASTGYGVPSGFAATSAARNHPHTPVRDNKSTGNILYIYTRARGQRIQEAAEDLREDPAEDPALCSDALHAAYYMALGYYPPPRIQQQLHALMEAGAAASLIEAVLAYTAEHAPRPTWAYAQAVMRRKLAEGITTAEAFECSVAAWYGQQEAQRAAAPAQQQPERRACKRVLEQLYEQRPYDAPKYQGGLTPEEIAEALRYTDGAGAPGAPAHRVPASGQSGLALSSPSARCGGQPGAAQAPCALTTPSAGQEAERQPAPFCPVA